MSPAIQQLRDGVAAHIAQSPTIIIPMRMPLIDDGFGGQVPSGTPSAQTRARVRIQHESSGVQKDAVVASGLDTSLSLYVLTDYNAPLQEGDTFAYLGFTWTVGVVNPFYWNGYLYKTEAPLVKGTAVPVTIPLAFTATADSDTEIDLAWTDEGAVNTYSIERKTGSAAFAVIATPAAGARAYSNTGLAALTAYTYRIRAYSGTTPSAYSDEATATTEEAPS